MKDTHTWAVEEVNGGPVGTDDVYRCTVCGCCGGGTEGIRFTGLWDNRQPGEEKPVKAEAYTCEPDPFIPGTGAHLSLDCATAHQQVLFFVHGYFRHWECTLGGDETARAYYRVLRAAHKYTPTKVARVAFYQVLWDLSFTYGQKKTTLDEARALLAGMGFKLASPNCTACGKPTDRPGDDKTELCYGCAMPRRS